MGNTLKVKRLNGGNYIVSVFNSNNELKKVSLTYWNGSKGDRWAFSNCDNFPTKKEALLAIEEIEWELL